MSMNENRKKRPWLWLLPLVLVVPLLGWGIYAATAPTKLELGGNIIEKPNNMQDITLLSTDGEPYSLRSLEGKLVLVFLGYANCPDICPLTMANLARIYEDLGSPEDLQVIMITVDPERDTPEQINNYATSFNPSFIGLTGSPEAIAETATRFFAGSTNVEGDFIAHSSHVTLLDRQGNMRAIYTQDKIRDFLQDDLETLLAHKGTW
jgi:protein SCO1/2